MYLYLWRRAGHSDMESVTPPERDLRPYLREPPPPPCLPAMSPPVVPLVMRPGPRVAVGGRANGLGIEVPSGGGAARHVPGYRGIAASARWRSSPSVARVASGAYPPMVQSSVAAALLQAAVLVAARFRG